MKLIYRGVSYDYNPNSSQAGNAGRARPAQLSQAPYKLIYRGVTTLVDPNAAPVLSASVPTPYELIYRGAAYQVTRAVEVAPAAQVQASRQPNIPSSLPRHYIGKVHQANLMRNLQHRLDVARQQGNQDLVALLEAERQQIAH